MATKIAPGRSQKILRSMGIRNGIRTIWAIPERGRSRGIRNGIRPIWAIPEGGRSNGIRNPPNRDGLHAASNRDGTSCCPQSRRQHVSSSRERSMLHPIAICNSRAQHAASNREQIASRTIASAACCIQSRAQHASYNRDVQHVASNRDGTSHCFQSRRQHASSNRERSILHEIASAACSAQSRWVAPNPFVCANARKARVFAARPQKSARFRAVSDARKKNARFSRDNVGCPCRPM